MTIRAGSPCRASPTAPPAAFAGNLFWLPVRNLDLGIEYRHAGREVVSGLDGQMDRIEMAAKYTF